MVFKPFHSMELIERDQARDVADIKGSLERALARRDSEHIDITHSLSFSPDILVEPPDVNIDFNPEVNVDVNIDTEGIEDGLFEIGTTLKGGLGDIADGTRDIAASGRTIAKSISEIAAEFRGMKKLRAFPFLNRYITHPDIYRAVYQEVMLNGNILANEQLLSFLQTGNIYQKVYALFELGERKAMVPYIIVLLNDENKFIATCAYQMLLKIKPAFLPRGSHYVKSYVSPGVPRCVEIQPNDTPEYATLLSVLTNGSSVGKRRAIRLITRSETGSNFWYTLVQLSINQDEKLRNDAYNTLLKISYTKIAELDSFAEYRSYYAQPAGGDPGYCQKLNAAMVVVASAKAQAEAKNSLVRLAVVVQYDDQYRGTALFSLATAVSRKGFDLTIQATSIFPALCDKSKETRKLATALLIAINPPLYRAGELGKKDNWARNICSYSQDSPVISELQKLLNSQNSIARQRAIMVIRGLKDGPKMTIELLKATGDAEERVRKLAVDALVSFREKIKPELENALKSSEEWYKNNAQLVLNRIAVRKEKDVLSQGTVKKPTKQNSRTTVTVGPVGVKRVRCPSQLRIGVG